jgi:HlyD family secretion protein
VIIEEEGETQVEQLYVISSPVTAFLRRIDFEVGDIVEKGQPLVYLEAPRATILDIRTRTEAMTRVEAAEARLVEGREQARRRKSQPSLRKKSDGVLNVFLIPDQFPCKNWNNGVRSRTGRG